MFTNESPLDLFQPPKRQNNSVWANHHGPDVLLTESVEQLPKIMMWGTMSYDGLQDSDSGLHDWPLRGGNHRQGGDICDEAAKKKGSPMVAKVLPDMSRAIFQQDGDLRRIWYLY